MNICAENGGSKNSVNILAQRLQVVLADHGDLPFLAVKGGGSPFPQLIDAKLEAFCLRAEQLHRRMLEYGGID